MRKTRHEEKLPAWQQSILHQPTSNSFSMGKHHVSPRKSGGRQRGHITQPTRGRGV